MGKDISYDGNSSTIAISDKNTSGSTDTKNSDNGKKDTTDSNKSVKKDPAESTPEKSTDKESNGKTRSGYAVINSFDKARNDSNIVANEFEGYIDGIRYHMFTSESNMITFSDKIPSVYGIKYNDKEITAMNLESPDVTDTIKESTGTKSIIGEKNTYDASPNVMCYEVIRNDDGSIDKYSIRNVLSAKAGYKVYLYELDGEKGYDVVLIETK